MIDDDSLLRDILATLERIEVCLTATRAPDAGADNRAWLGALLPELQRSRETTIWTAADVIDAADGRPALFSLIEDYLDADGARRLGRRLASCAGIPAAGLMLERIGNRGGVGAYRVVSGGGVPLQPFARIAGRG